MSSTSDPLYHDVSPVYERYTKMFLIASGVVCLTSIVCALIQAQEEKKFYGIIISLALSLIFVICIYLFFKKRILLAEKLWFVNLTILILFIQAILFITFVFIKPYPVMPTTVSPRPTTRTTPHFTTSFPHNSTNRTNVSTSTTRSTSTTTKKFIGEKQIILTKLYELDET